MNLTTCALFTAAAAAASVAAASTGPVPAHNHDVQPIVAEHSKMTVYVYKQGLFAFAADNHEINAPIKAGSFDSAKDAIELTVDATKMKVLDPSMPEGRRNTVQSNMESAMVLDIAKYPTIAFHSTKIEPGEKGHLAVTGDLTLHGQTHPVRVDVIKTDATHFKGSATVRQTDFGITPIRIAAGTVKVKDDVSIQFEIEISGG